MRGPDSGLHFVFCLLFLAVPSAMSLAATAEFLYALFVGGTCVVHCGETVLVGHTGSEKNPRLPGLNWAGGGVKLRAAGEHVPGKRSGCGSGKQNEPPRSALRDRYDHRALSVALRAEEGTVSLTGGGNEQGPRGAETRSPPCDEAIR